MPFPLTASDLEGLMPQWMLRQGAHVAIGGGVRLLAEAERLEVASYEGRVSRWTVFVDLYPDGRIAHECGSCGDEMCMHVAAVLYALAEGHAIEAEGAPSGRVEPWRRALERALGGGVGAASSEIALLVGTDPGGFGTPPGVHVRPVVRGARGAWIRKGIGWRELERATPEQARVLGEISALYEAREHFPAGGTGSSGGGSRRSVSRWGSYDRAPQWIRLDELPSRGLWDLLGELQDAGIRLVADAKAQPEIGMRAEPARHQLDIARDEDGALHVTPLVDLEVGSGVDLLPIGSPVIAMALADGDHVTELVPLADPLSEGFARLALGDAFVVPASAVADFERDYLPKLRRLAPVDSRDGSYDVPAIPAPALILTIAHDASRARLVWRWDHAAAAPRLPAEERRIGDAVVAAAGERADLLGVREGTGFGAAWLTRDESVEFFAAVLPALRQVDGLRIEETDELPEYRFAGELPVVHVSAQPHGNDWFDLEVGVDVGGEAVPLGMLLAALVARDRYLVLPSGAVFTLSADRFEPLRQLLDEARGLQDRATGPLRISRLQVDLWTELAQTGVVEAQEQEWLQSLRALSDADRLEPVPAPDGFRATLREYQKVGLAWLDFLRVHRLGGILADDMGLGKTVQVLAALERARADEPDARFLVVTPTSVVGHWVAEAERFAPGLRPVGIEETAGKRGTPLADAAADARLIVTSYALFRLDFAEYEELGFRVLVLDEAQQIKNHRSQGYRCARLLTAPTKFAVTGTPLENNLLELWALVSLTAPGLLGGEKSFTDHYRKPIERERDGERLARLRRRIRPFLLRRTKDRVAADLPEKTEQLLEVELHGAHRRTYELRLQRERQKVMGLLDDVKANRMEILRSLTTLRMLALDPELVGEAPAPSAKLDKLGELLEEIVGDGHSALVFSQFTTFLGRAAGVAERRGIPFAYLDGSVTAPQRRRMIDRFTSGDVPVFFISLKAGGFGLNLTQADYCILLDPWWNPAAELQATDRAHRIGQTRPVVVYRLISQGTIESKVVSMQEKKSRLFRDVLAGDEDPGAIGGLTAEDFRALVQ